MGKISVLILMYCVSSFARDSLDERTFFEKVNKSYYILNQTNIKNFTALVTSFKMEIYAQDSWQNKEVFPLQIIWLAPDRFYLSQQGVPTLAPDKYQEYQTLVDGIKVQMKGILLDLHRFYGAGIYPGLGSDYKFRRSEEAVQITAKEGDASNPTQVKYLFGFNGLCLMIEIAYPREDKLILIYPDFLTLKDQWLCKGWTVQTLIAGEVQSGFKVEIKNDLINSVWVPVEITINVQKAEDPGATYYDLIKLKSYLFNRDIKTVEDSTSTR